MKLVVTAVMLGKKYVWGKDSQNHPNLAVVVDAEADPAVYARYGQRQTWDTELQCVAQSGFSARVGEEGDPGWYAGAGAQSTTNTFA